MPLLWIAIILTSYVIGSIPFGYLIGLNCAGIDITKRGSGNIGATNIAREAGLRYGIATLILDVLKGLFPVMVTVVFFDGTGPLAWFSGLGTILGHQFSIFLRFRGGKGVATAIGVYIFIAPLECIAALVIFFITVRIWDFISLGSLILSLCVPIIFFVSSGSGLSIIMSSIIAALIVFKHRGNIHRMFRGKERRWSLRKIR